MQGYCAMRETVTQGHLLLCQSMQHDFLLALSGTNYIQTVIEIPCRICTSIPHLLQAEREKMAWNRWTCFGVWVPRTLDHKLWT